ncbi:hypothetical protein E8E13_000581 [Curvularia kusanoi]|uniref:RING-type domain-containing protein n=1 Tax=Curvularia kusanoi TaxID=90978 RepID=A0A9P4T457_CURKU|nr:hypothetical protein E8E13_000581 [Curvularia kusanoi]
MAAQSVSVTPLDYDDLLLEANIFKYSKDPYDFKNYINTVFRWPKDVPVAFDSLNRARIFRTLMHFFSSLIIPNPMLHNDEEIQTFWDGRVEELRNDAHPTYYNDYVLEIAISIIEQLDPHQTYGNINIDTLRDWHPNGDPEVAILKGDPEETFRYNTTEGDYSNVSRGYDWILRCAFEFDIPLEWRAWIGVMYNAQPYRSWPRCGDSWLRVAQAPQGTLSMSYWIPGKKQEWNWVVPMMKWWIRNAFNILGSWHASLKYGGDFGELKPEYSWVAIAYEKMWNRFKNMLQDPFSEYPYGLRENVLRNFTFKTVFELSWITVKIACGSTSTEDVKMEDLRSFELREKICRSVCESAQRIFLWSDLNPPFDIFGLFETEWPELCQEGPEVDFDALADGLPLRTTLIDGLCSRWYDLPYASGEWSALYDNSDNNELDIWDRSAIYGDSESESDIWEDRREFELTEDIEMECYGSLINIYGFTVDKEPDVEDFCTWCQDGWSQENIGTFDSSCVVPQTCQHTFHADCLADWVNGPSPSSNLCPNCKVQMTPQMRSRRPVIKDDSEQ